MAERLVTADDLSQDWGITPDRVRAFLRERKVLPADQDAQRRNLYDEDQAHGARKAGRELAIPAGGKAVVPAGWNRLTQDQRDNYLSPDAAERIRSGIPQSTWDTYLRQWQKFSSWCERTLRTPLPVTEHVMCEYVQYLSTLSPRPAPSTLWIWYSAVRFVHRMGSPPAPWECGKRLELAIRSYVNEMIDMGWRPKKAPRAFPHYVQQMTDCCDLSTIGGIRDKSIILVGFLTAARASHMRTYRIADVHRQPGGLDFWLPRSKNDPDAAGKHFPVAKNDDHPQYCPVRATRAWMKALDELGHTSGALYRPLEYGRLSLASADPAFKMSGFALTKVVRKYGRLAGLGNDFTMHSLRRGYASWLRELGFDQLAIARGLDWSPNSKSILEYLEEVDRWAEEAPALVARL